MIYTFLERLQKTKRSLYIEQYYAHFSLFSSKVNIFRLKETSLELSKQHFPGEFAII